MDFVAIHHWSSGIGGAIQESHLAGATRKTSTWWCLEAQKTREFPRKNFQGWSEGFVHLSRFPKTNKQFAPENRPIPKGKLVFQPYIFRCKLAVSFGEGNRKRNLCKHTLSLKVKKVHIFTWPELRLTMCGLDSWDSWGNLISVKWMNYFTIQQPELFGQHRTLICTPAAVPELRSPLFLFTWHILRSIPWVTWDPRPIWMIPWWWHRLGQINQVAKLEGGVSVDAQRLNIGVVGGENLRMNCWLRSDVLRPQPCCSRPRATKWQFTMVILLGLYRPSGWVKVTVHFMIMVFGCFWGERPALWFEFL